MWLFTPWRSLWIFFCAKICDKAHKYVKANRILHYSQLWASMLFFSLLLQMRKKKFISGRPSVFKKKKNLEQWNSRLALFITGLINRSKREETKQKKIMNFRKFSFLLWTLLLAVLLSSYIFFSSSSWNFQVTSEIKTWDSNVQNAERERC